MSTEAAQSLTIQDLQESINQEKQYHLSELLEYTQYIEQLAQKTGDKKLHDIHCHLLNLQSIDAAECQIDNFLLNVDHNR